MSERMRLRDMSEEWIARNFGLLCGHFDEAQAREVRAEYVESGGDAEDGSWFEGAGWRVWAAGDSPVDSYVTTAAHAEKGDAWDEAEQALDEDSSEGAVGREAHEEHLARYEAAREFHGRMMAL